MTARGARRLLRPAVLLPLVLSAVVVAIWALAGGPERPQPGESPAATAQVDPTSGPAATAFIVTTAEQLCEVQSAVYDDAAALAAAYAERPEYPTLDATEVARFQRLLAEDAGFARRLTAEVAATCG